MEGQEGQRRVAFDTGAAESVRYDPAQPVAQEVKGAEKQGQGASRRALKSAAFFQRVRGRGRGGGGRQ